MPTLLTQADVRRARNSSFCYLCGEPFKTSKDRHPDHIPPKAIFAESDRNFPLKVAAHFECNNKNAATDQALGQLIAVIHGKYPAQDDIALKFRQYNVAGEPFLGFVNTSVVGQIARWVRGFHAALYEEFLPNETPSAIHPPFPHGKLTTDGFTIKNILDQQYLFVEVLKKNRIARCLDRIVCNNGKLVYECVWVRMDQGHWACLFALQIYNWSRLADHTHFPKRSCVGWYQPISGLPAGGTIGTQLDFPIQNSEPLDAFGG